MPSHNHEGTVASSNLYGTFGFGKGAEGSFASGVFSRTTGSNVSYSAHVNQANSGQVTYTLSGSHSHSLTINNNGGGNYHNNMQPFVSIYIWKRVS